MHWSGERATLTLVHLNKEDEGLYTLRVNTKSGFDSYSAYVFVRGEASTPSRISRLETSTLSLILVILISYTVKSVLRFNFGCAFKTM